MPSSKYLRAAVLTCLQATAPVTLTPDEQQLAAGVRLDTVREITTTLASSEFEGRGTAQSGGDRAAHYLAGRFQSIGLTAHSEAGYVQPMKVRVRSLGRNTHISVGQERFTFVDDFVLAQPGGLDDPKTVSGRLAFVGYGVVSSELHRDDLLGVDVKGKIVVVLRGRPGGVDPAVWAKVSTDREVFGRLITRGAAGLIVTQDGPLPFSSAAALISHRRVWLDQPVPNPFRLALWSLELLADEFQMPPAALISDSAVDRMLATQRDTADLRARAMAGAFVSRELSVQATIAPQLEERAGETANVVGVLPGSDPVLRDTAVVVVAHYDAYGVNTRGTMWPGAIDNALGVGKMVAIAEALARHERRTRRSVIFLATTGEEFGNLGSAFWLQNPTWRGRITAAINLDGGVEVWGALGFIIDPGTSSPPASALRDAARRMNLAIVPDPFPQQQFVARGDAREFNARGVPAASVYAGPIADPQALEQRVNTWMTTHYHMPSDVVGAGWNWNAARRVGVLTLLAILALADV